MKIETSGKKWIEILKLLSMPHGSSILFNPLVLQVGENDIKVIQENIDGTCAISASVSRKYFDKVEGEGIVIIPASPDTNNNRLLDYITRFCAGEKVVCEWGEMHLNVKTKRGNTNLLLTDLETEKSWYKEEPYEMLEKNEKGMKLKVKGKDKELNMSYVIKCKAEQIAQIIPLTEWFNIPYYPLMVKDGAFKMGVGDMGKRVEEATLYTIQTDYLSKKEDMSVCIGGGLENIFTTLHGDILIYTDTDYLTWITKKDKLYTIDLFIAPRTTEE